jgi:hypothetical protein
MDGPSKRYHIQATSVNELSTKRVAHYSGWVERYGKKGVEVLGSDTKNSIYNTR